MSDDGWGEDDNGGGWSDNEQMQEEQANDIENTFYHGEATMNDPQQAIEKFETTILLAEGQDEYDYRFKSYMWIVYLSAKIQDYQKMENSTQVLLNLMHKVAPNEADNAISKVLECLDRDLMTHPEL